MRVRLAANPAGSLIRLARQAAWLARPMINAQETTDGV
jgi:hypothetical protein